MKRKDTNNQFIIEASDYQGDFEFRLHRAGIAFSKASHTTQLQVVQEDDEIHINMSVKELTGLRDMINDCLNSFT